MAEILNVEELPKFLEWVKEKYAYDKNMAVSKLLNVMRRKIIRVAGGKIDKRTEYDELMQEFLNDTQP